MEHDHDSIERLIAKLDSLHETLEKLYENEKEERSENKISKKRLILKNLTGGIFKGLGYAIGFTILGAIVVLILQAIVANNIPIIGRFVAKILDAIDGIRG